ncbi:MAG: nucleotide exchange factor GrpE [Candidatus Niyogibacteria bacterium]|nr:nucleotide exchange factor GrpE [Candidatus Niyogibacteria bacterium]
MNEPHKKYDQEEIEIIDEGESAFAEAEADEEEDAAADKLKKAKKELASCRKEKQEYLEGWQRAKADLINYKKDESRRNELIAKFASEDMVYDILPVLDNFDLALQHDMSDDVRRGITMIRSQFEDALKRRGVEAIVVQLGESFDITKHESVGEMESAVPEGTIAEELQKGFMMHGKVIRASKVKLAKKSISR